MIRRLVDVLLRRTPEDDERASKARLLASVKRDANLALLRAYRALDHARRIDAAAESYAKTRYLP